ncbi:MAG: hypothetical protein Q4E28_00385 [Clostridia bacterium]|nr:hypothetical protein [Clostridia bacterium]
MKTEREKGIFLIISIFTLILLPLRTFHVMTGVENATGFLVDMKPLNYAIYAILSIAAIVLAVLCFADSEFKKKNQILNENNKLSAIPAILMTIFLLFDAATSIAQLSINLSTVSVGSLPVMTGEFVRNGTFSLAFRTLFAILSSVYFSILGISILKKDMKYKKSAIMALTPVMWIISKFMLLLINPIRFKNVPYILLELAFLACAAIFFYSFASSIYLNTSTHSLSKIFFSGGLLIIIGAINIFPSFLKLIAMEEVWFDIKFVELIPDFGILIFVFSIILFLTIKNNDDVVQTPKKREKKIVLLFDNLKNRLN